ncbi:MAG: hypothetical protein BRC33_05990 [Cyanobacteria bacterium SW_9_44_58]|nr:MAG: hypothetical protein BRC33_05990 [Cyanobacteria bacterium SW_9_44_58]
MTILMQAETAAEANGGFPISFTLVYIVGFIAAVTIGSIAWYNSKRPAGWEGQERPDWIPEVDTKKDQESDQNS